MEVVRVIRSCESIKKPNLLASKKIEIFATEKLSFNPAEYQKKSNSGIVIILPKKVKGFNWLLDGKVADIIDGENKLYFILWIFKLNFYT